MKIIKCFITYKSAVIDNAPVSINPPISLDEFSGIFLDDPNEQKLKAFGQRLFQRIFTAQALEKYSSTEPSALAISVSDDLAYIPWELLHDDKDWIARTRGIFRIANTSRNSPNFIQKSGNLKILVALSSPILNETMPDDDPEQISFIDVDHHENLFRKLEGKRLQAQIKIRRHITRESFSWELGNNHHVLHFVGHGNIGKLVFETRHASVDLVDESWINEQIVNGLRGNLRLIVLDTYHSADSSDEVYKIANSILSTSIPALIIMQGNMSYLANETFVKTFYEALAKGNTIDKALMLSRHAIASDWQIKPDEWALPVLFINDSLLNEETSLNIIDEETIEMIAEPSTKIVSQQRAVMPLMLTREQKCISRRREISDVLLSLDPQRKDSAKNVCLYGEAGIGKTCIAIESTHRMAEWFDQIICLSGYDTSSNVINKELESQINNPKRFLIALGNKCGFSISDDLDSKIKDDILISLNDGTFRLLVLDGIENLSKSEVIISFLNGLPQNCKALIISREPFEINGRQIKVNMMNKLDAVKLLSHYGKDIPINELEEIVHLTGGHPMLIRLLVSQAVYGDKKLDNIIKDLRKAKGDMLDHVINNSIKLALKDGRKVFAIMSLFYPTISRKALQEICGQNDSIFTSALNRIINLSLVESYGQGKRLGLHHLMIEKSKKLLSEDQDKELYFQRKGEFLQKFLRATIPMTQQETAIKAIEAQMPEGTEKEKVQEITWNLLINPALQLIDIELLNCFSLMDYLLDKGEIDRATEIINLLGSFLLNNNYWDVIKYYNLKMIDILKENGDKRSQANALFNMAILCYNQGKLIDAIDMYEPAYKLAHEIDDKMLEINSLNAIGVINMKFGKPNEAIQYFEESLNISQTIGNDMLKAGLMNNIAIIYKETNQNEKALEYFNNSLKIFNQIGDKHNIIMIQNNLAELYMSMGRYEDAIECYQKSISIYDELGEKKQQSDILDTIGVIYRDIGEVDKALKYHSDSLIIAREIGDLICQHKALVNTAISYSKKESWTESGNACIEDFMVSIQVGANVVMDSLKCILEVSKNMLQAGEYEMPAQLVYRFTQLMEKIDPADSEIKTALAISQGIFTMIGLVSASEWNKSNDVYKEAVELAKSLDNSTNSALGLLEWLEIDR